MLPADIQLVHSNDISNLTDPEWDKNAFGPRFESMISTSYLENHKNEWVEIRYDFKAKAPYVGVSIPGLTKVWIDDACITLKSADASYKRSIDGPGISYDELVNINLDEDEEVKETSKIIIKPATAEVESGEYKYVSTPLVLWYSNGIETRASNTFGNSVELKSDGKQATPSSFKEFITDFQKETTADVWNETFVSGLLDYSN